MVYGSSTVVSSELRDQRALVKGSLCVRRNGQSAKRRKYVVLAGFGPDHNLGVYDNNVDTIERAFTERYFLCKDGGSFRPALRVKSQVYKAVGLGLFRESVMANMPRLPMLSRAQVVAAYRGSKRRVYENAHKDLLESPIHKRDARLTSFVKFEKQDIGKAPRCINPRSPRYNLELGRFLKHAEKHYFRAINLAYGAHTPATVIKGVNADVSACILRAKWDRFTDPIAVGLDASKFDMHVSVPALKYEHSYYVSLFPRSKLLRRLLKWQLFNGGVARARDGIVKFGIEGTRSSGDLNTSLGNCILMCALVWSYLRTIRIDAELANNGDDCVVFLERRDEGRFRMNLCRWFRKRGFDIKLEPTVCEFEHVEFCQTRPIQLSTGWRMVRNLSAVLTKDPMCLVPVPNSRVLRKWLDAVGTCGGALCGGVPVMGALYACFKRHGLPCGKLIEEVYRNRAQLQLSVGLKQAEVTAVARVSFYYAFGVLPDEQVALERWYDGIVIDCNLPVGIERQDLHSLPGPNAVLSDILNWQHG